MPRRWNSGPLLAAVLLAGCAERPVSFHADSDPELLSAWGLMQVTGGKLELHPDVIPYDLNSVLFSDYAHKLRTLWVPAGASATADPDGRAQFPVGTILSKTFFYPRREDGTLLQTVDNGQAFDAQIGRAGGLDLARNHVLETRLLIRRDSGWVALPYLWQPDQSDAVLQRSGAIRSVSLHGAENSVSFDYLVPDQNQCAGCHGTHHAQRDIHPIGPTVQNLDRAFPYASGSGNQLQHLQARRLLVARTDSSPMTDWRDESASVSARARAYLHINCAHCHSATGPANTSGLYLDLTTTDPRRLGRCKRPIAAGQGTGGHSYSIVPGHPERSILVYRMQSLDPGGMMPEIGRAVVHAQGVALIWRWIAAMEGECT